MISLRSKYTLFPALNAPETKERRDEDEPTWKDIVHCLCTRGKRKGLLTKGNQEPGQVYRSSIGHQDIRLLLGELARNRG